VFNKVDLISEEEFARRKQVVLTGLQWIGPIYVVSALQKKGLKPLCHDLMTAVEELEK